MPWGRHWGGGVPISHNALQHYPECHGADTRGYPYPIMLCNITQNAMGHTPGGVPCQVRKGGTQVGYPPSAGYPPPQARMGGTQVRYLPLGGYPPGPGWGVGTQVGYPPGSGRGGTQVGQPEYSLQGGHYASCVHAGGLSCYKMKLNVPQQAWSVKVVLMLFSSEHVQGVSFYFVSGIFLAKWFRIQ